MHVLSQFLLACVLVVGSIAAIAGAFTLAGWKHIRETWNKPVTLRDYLAFRRAAIHNDTEGIFRVARKYGYVFGLLLMLIAVPVWAQAPSTPSCPAGFDCEGFDGTIVKDEPPALPDYMDAPFRWVGESPRVTLAEFPELGLLSVTAYATTDRPAPGTNAVYVLKRVMDNRLAYAEWQEISGDGKTVFRRIYLYQGATYLPDYGKWIFRSSVIQPINLVID